MTEQPQLVLLPGLGADGRLFDVQRRAGLDVRTPAWLEPELREPLPDYARRLAENVELTGPLVLGGVSFGGMVAMEMARWLKPRAIVLIGSSRTGLAVPRLLRWLSPLAGVLKPAQDMTVAPAGFGLWLLGEKVTPDHGELLHRMLRDTTAAFFKWAAQAVPHWTFDGEPIAPVQHIHGRRDRLLRPKIVQQVVDEWIDDGGHMINLTHAERVNAFLLQCLATARERSGAMS